MAAIVFKLKSFSMSGKRSARAQSPNAESSRTRKRPRTSRNPSTYDKLVHLVHFWLSPTNLSHDRFLTNVMLHAEGWVPVSQFVTFRKVSQLGASEKDVLNALRAVRSPPLEFSTDGAEGVRVRIAGGLMELKRLIDGVRDDEDERTIYIETLAAGVTRERVIDVFKRFGDVAYVSVPRFPGGSCKGFGFVEYKDIQAAAEALRGVREKEVSEGDFANLRALPRAEWRRRKDKYKDQRHSAQVANAKAKKRGNHSLQERHLVKRGDAAAVDFTPVMSVASEDNGGEAEGAEGAQQEACADDDGDSREVECDSEAAQAALASDEQGKQLSNNGPDDQDEDEIEVEARPTPSFESGLILAISGLQVTKRKVTRRLLFEALTQYGKMGYVDYSPKTPNECKARFVSVDAAQAACSALSPSGGGKICGTIVTASILTGASERAYWVSIQAQRESRRARASSKNGDKAARKAARRAPARRQPARAGKGD